MFKSNKERKQNLSFIFAVVVVAVGRLLLLCRFLVALLFQMVFDSLFYFILFFVSFSLYFLFRFVSLLLAMRMRLEYRFKNCIGGEQTESKKKSSKERTTERIYKGQQHAFIGNSSK